MFRTFSCLRVTHSPHPSFCSQILVGYLQYHRIHSEVFYDSEQIEWKALIGRKVEIMRMNDLKTALERNMNERGYEACKACPRTRCKGFILTDLGYTTMVPITRIKC